MAATVDVGFAFRILPPRDALLEAHAMAAPSPLRGFIERQSETIRMATSDAQKLFVAGLPDSVTEEVLRGLFTESGSNVVELTLPRDRMTGRPRGFAFVRLGSNEEADRARSVLDGRILDGRSISVRPFQAEPPARGEGRPAMGEGRPPMGDRPPREPRGAGGPAPDRTLYVGNLPYDATQEEIETLLTGLGVEPVLRVHLPLDQDGRKRGFGFVTLGSGDVAKNAIDQLKGAELRSRRLIVNLAHPKGSGPADGPGDRPPRVEGLGGPPRAFGGPPPGNFGPPSPPGGAKGNDRRRRKFDEGGGGGDGRGAARGARRERDDNSWRDDVDDD